MAYVRLKDIAEKAGVSTNTVSRALKDHSDIGDATKDRIRHIADELGYIPNISASRLRSNDNKMIGVIITHIDNAFYARILQGINDAVGNLGYTILALSSGEDLGKEEELLKTMVANRVAGMILVPSRDLENTLNYDHIGVPHITIVRKGSLNTRSYCITDSLKSGYLAAKHFAGLGCHRPAYIGFDLPVSCNRDRLEGFRNGLRENGIDLDPKRTLACPSSHQAAYETTLNLLAVDSSLDSIFVYNDVMALGVIRAVLDSGLRVPDDIRILGHDDIADSSFYSPSLSTIRVPKYRMGFEAATELIDLLQDGETPEKTIVYEPELVIRES